MNSLEQHIKNNSLYTVHFFQLSTPKRDNGQNKAFFLKTYHIVTRKTNTFLRI